MKHTRKSARAIALTIKPLATGVFVFFLFVLSLALLLFSKNHSSTMEDVRMAIVNTTTPVVQALAAPVDTLHGIGNWVRDMSQLREENLALKADNARLLRWQFAATELASENDRLRHLLKFAPTAAASYISARIAIDGVSAYSHSVIINAGLTQGISRDAAVLNESGLVGRVIEAGQKTSRILLLTDVNSRIPVITQSSREHAIAGGNGTDTLSLLYLPENTKVKVGETIVTSGDGNVIPEGLPVGIVTKIEKDAATIQTFADWHRLEYVSVVEAAK